MDRGRLAAAMGGILLWALLAVAPAGAGPTLATIVVDGGFDDWVAVLANSSNVTTDAMKGLGDLDDPISADRDLVKHAWTHDATYLYTYVQRTTGGSNISSVLLYLDGDADGVMESGERVIEFRWSGATRQYDSVGHNYVPANQAGDPLAGDGATMPGSVSGSATIESNVAGGAEDGIRLEARVPWTELGGSGPRGLRIHVAIARGTNLPNQVEDNMAAVDTRFAAVTLGPSNSGAGAQGATVSYSHTVTNTGSGSDSFALTTSGTRPQWTVVVAPATVGPLAPNASGTVTVQITIPANAPNGAVDTTIVRATSVSNGAAYAEATDTTSAGAVVVSLGQSSSSAVNQMVSYAHAVRNFQPFADTINLSASSSAGWSTAFFQGGAPVASVPLGAGASAAVELRVSVPAGASVGTVDTTTVTGASQADSRVKGTATDRTTVATRLAAAPSNAGATGPNSTISYNHTITNSWSGPDTVNLAAVSSHGWTTRIYDATGLTPISSLDLAAFGGSAGVVVHLDVPEGVAEGTVDTVTLTASSASAPGVSASATDTTTVRILIAYSDPGRTQMATDLALGATAYARATGLTRNSKVYFRWVDAGGTARATSPQVTVDALGMALHQYATLSGDTASSGTPESVWTAILLNSSYVELARYEFHVRRADHLAVSPNPSAAVAGTGAMLTVQVVDIDGRAVPSAQAATVGVGGSATVTATSLAGATGVGGSSVAGTTGSEGSATVTVLDNRAEAVMVTPDSAALPGSLAVPDRDVAASVVYGPGAAYGVRGFSGGNQVAAAAGPLPADFVVEVTDAYDNPLSDPATVVFAMAGAPSSATGQGLSVTTATTDSNGQARTRLTLGNREGRYRATATGPDLVEGPVAFTASHAGYAPLWTFDVGAPIYSSAVIPGSDPPYISEDVVYVGADGAAGDGGWVFGLYATTGAEKWRFNLRSAPSGLGGNVRGFLQVWWDESAGKYVLYLSASNGHVYALNLDGTLYWESTVSAGLELSSPIPAGPVNVSGHGPINVVYVGSADGRLYGLKSTTGQVVLSSPAPFGGPVLSTPAIPGDYLWVGSDDGTVNRVALNSLTVLWSVNTGGAVRSSPWVDYQRNSVYIASTSGRVFALDAGNGGVLSELDLGTAIYSSPWVNEGAGAQIYLGADDHRLYRLDFDGTDLTVAPGWPYNLDTGTTGWIRSSPLVFPGNGGEYVYLGGMDELVHVAREDSPSSGYLSIYDSLASYPGAFNSSPATNGSIVVVGGLNGRVYAFPAK